MIVENVEIGRIVEMVGLIGKFGDMSRHLHIEYPDAYYHVMKQGLIGQAALISGGRG